MLAPQKIVVIRLMLLFGMGFGRITRNGGKKKRKNVERDREKRARTVGSIRRRVREAAALCARS